MSVATNSLRRNEHVQAFSVGLLNGKSVLSLDTMTYRVIFKILDSLKLKSIFTYLAFLNLSHAAQKPALRELEVCRVDLPRRG